VDDLRVVVVVVVVADCAEASPAPARTADAVTIENRDFRIGVSFWK
jgi:hypothetical protein